MPQLKKLHRSTHNSLLAGVCGGFAEYFGWNASVLRVVLVLSVIISASLTFFGLSIVYALLWILMPRATQQSYVTSHK